jgi:glutamine synthetase
MLRHHALRTIIDREPRQFERPANKISAYYGEDVFNHHVMREYLTEEAYDSIMEAMEHHTPIDRKVADQAASAMNGPSPGELRTIRIGFSR